MPHADHSAMKLGKQPARHDPRTLRLAKYVQLVPHPPDVIDWTTKVPSWKMHMNDRLGCCAIASAAHHVHAWTANGHLVSVDPSDASVLKAYEAVSGYRLGHPETDKGCVELDALRYWRKVGVGGHKIGAFAAVSPQNQTIVRDAIWLFGGAYSGFALPLSAQTQTVWDVPLGGTHGAGAPNSWGGHAVPLLAADARGVTCVTWGKPKRMTWAFVAAYCDELYAMISQDFLTGNKAPNGFDLAALTEDLAQVAT